MGGSSSSSFTNKTVNQSWDYSTHVTQTDHGAVEAGKKMSLKALDAMGKNNAEAFQFASGNTSKAFQFASDNVSKAANITLAALDLAKSVSDKPFAALAFMERTSNNAMEIVANATQPADQSTQETMVKWGAMTAIALGIAQVIKK